MNVLREDISTSISCLLSFVKPDEGSKVQNYDDLYKFAEDFVVSRILDSFSQNSIIESYNNEKISFFNDINEKIRGYLKDNSFGNWRFYIDGFPKTGRSTILGFFAINVLFYLKFSNFLPSVFVFSVNWEKATKSIFDVYSLYNFVVGETINSLSYQFPRILPIRNALIKWFLSIPLSSSLLPLPISIKKMKHFPYEYINDLANSHFLLFKAESVECSSLISEILAIPSKFSRIFGFERCFFVYSHIDFCDIEFSITRGDLETKCSFLDIILQSVSQEQYVIDSKFLPISTEILDQKGVIILNPIGMISNDFILDSSSFFSHILVSNPPIRLSPEMCRGCPLLLHQYHQLMKMVTHYLESEDQKLKKLSLMTCSRQFLYLIISKNLEKLIISFSEVGTFNNEKEVIKRLKSINAAEIILKK